MKNVVSILAFVLVLSFSSQIMAQDQGQIRLGGSLALGSKAGINDTGNKLGVGINFGGDYFIIDNLSAGLSYSYFFKSSYTINTIEISQRISSVNIDGKYYFLNDPINVYGLLGFSVLSVTAGINGTTSSSSELGINLGAGVDYPLSDKLSLNGQLKFNSPFEQLVINLGVFYTLK